MPRSLADMIYTEHFVWPNSRAISPLQSDGTRNGIAPLAMGGQLCNIGMMAIPARILQKPRGLSDSERHVLHTHTQYGAELLRKSRVRMLDVASMIAEQHHEHHDGSGYPRGLRGESIAEEARIVAVCDAFDAMTHRRPWRPTPLSIQAALNELKQGAGTQFDPRLVEVFVESDSARVLGARRLRCVSGRRC